MTPPPPSLPYRRLGELEHQTHEPNSRNMTMRLDQQSHGPGIKQTTVGTVKIMEVRALPVVCLYRGALPARNT